MTYLKIFPKEITLAWKPYKQINPKLMSEGFCKWITERTPAENFGRLSGGISGRIRGRLLEMISGRMYEGMQG